MRVQSPGVESLGCQPGSVALMAMYKDSRSYLHALGAAVPVCSGQAVADWCTHFPRSTSFFPFRLRASTRTARKEGQCTFVCYD